MFIFANHFIKTLICYLKIIKTYFENMLHNIDNFLSSNEDKIIHLKLTNNETMINEMNENMKNIDRDIKNEINILKDEIKKINWKPKLMLKNECIECITSNYILINKKKEKTLYIYDHSINIICSLNINEIMDTFMEIYEWNKLSFKMTNKVLIMFNCKNNIIENKYYEIVYDRLIPTNYYNNDSFSHSKKIVNFYRHKFDKDDINFQFDINNHIITLKYNGIDKKMLCFNQALVIDGKIFPINISKNEDLYKCNDCLIIISTDNLCSIYDFS